MAEQPMGKSMGRYPETADSHRMEAEVVADLARKAVEPMLVQLTRPEDSSAAPVLVLPEGHEAHGIKAFLDEYLERPERRTGTAVLEELASFIAHVKRFADEDSVVFAKRQPPGLLAVLDYHEMGAIGAPRWGQHRAFYAFPLADEWKAWLAANGPGKAMTQAAFAEFIESRIVDVRDPEAMGENTRARLASIGATAAPPWRLLNLSRGLAIRAGVSVQNVVNLATGEAQIEYVTTHQDANGRALDVPSAFVIAIPVFQRGTPYEIAVRLRYRLREGVISWFYEMLGHEVVFEDAFRGACEEAEERTALPLYYGSPEQG